MRCAYVLLVALGVLTASFAAQVKPVPSGPPAFVNREDRAAIAKRYYAAIERGDLERARVILERERFPIGDGSLQAAARLCYELRDYDQALIYLERFEASQVGKEIVPLGRAQNLTIAIMIRAGAAGRAPQWKQLHSLSPKIEVGERVLQAALSASAMGFMRSADFLLGELPKVGVSAERIQNVRRRILERKGKIAGNAKNSGG